ncbi:NrsF family protein [Methylopila henanensis]|uniref:NrsF family protein n=1 Tax=Methylopila henanensis TaxID=873516 RepID=A0ABW4KC69_9HYPH
MRTDQLIGALAQDAATPPVRLTRVFALATLAAVVAAGLVFMIQLGPRPDFMASLGTLRFPFKFVVTTAFAAAAAALVLRLSRPAAPTGPAKAALGAALTLLALGLAAELNMTPEASWAARMIGRNALVCLTYIPLIAAAPLGLLLVALRRGAPSSPAAAGAAAGLLAGAIAATFYAAHCTDDSPLFVAVWYSAAVAIVTCAGAVLGGRLLRW